MMTTMAAVRVELGRQVSPGVWEWSAYNGGTCGRSSEPLLDACRALKRMGEPLTQEVRLFWPGGSDWALRTTIGVGAGLTCGRAGFQKHRPRQPDMEPEAGPVGDEEAA